MRVGVDVGTSSVRVFVQGRGLVLDEPSVVAVDDKLNRIIAVGREASRMQGRTPARIQAFHPLKNGVAADIDLTAQMLKTLLKQALGWRMALKPKYFLCVPAGATPMARSAFADAAAAAGAAGAELVDEPIAAAVGAGLNVHDPEGCMVVDVGGATTEVAVISMGCMVAWTSANVGGNDMDNAIQRMLHDRYGLLVEDVQVEQIKRDIGSAIHNGSHLRAQVHGKSLAHGLPANANIDAEHVWQALQRPLELIADAIKSTLDQIPPDLAADILDGGFVLTGGGALLKGLDVYLSDATHIPVTVAENPLACGVDGCTRAAQPRRKKPAARIKERDLHAIRV